MELIEKIERKAMLCGEYLFEVMDLCQNLDFNIFNGLQLYMIVTAIKENMVNEDLKQIANPQNNGGKMFELWKKGKRQVPSPLEINTEEETVELLIQYQNKYQKLIDMGISDYLIEYLKTQMIKRDQNRIECSIMDVNKIHEEALTLAYMPEEIQLTVNRQKSKIPVKNVQKRLTKS